jgi:hypothetical protein
MGGGTPEKCYVDNEYYRYYYLRYKNIVSTIPSSFLLKLDKMET